MHLYFTDDWRGYSAGQEVDVPASTARSALAAGVAEHGTVARAKGLVETADRSQPEHTARRTDPPKVRDPREAGWRYKGSGWWEAPDGSSVRAPESADMKVLRAKREDGT